jgi:hypothetical protein
MKLTVSPKVLYVLSLIRAAAVETLYAARLLVRAVLCLPLAVSWLLMYWTLWLGWGAHCAETFVWSWEAVSTCEDAEKFDVAASECKCRNSKKRCGCG